MRTFKISYFLFLIILFTYMFAMNSYASSRPIFDKFPAYSIYPNERTSVQVNSHEIEININNDEHQTATFINKYTLENPSETDTLLKFIFPLYGSDNVKVLVNDTNLNYFPYLLFNNGKISHFQNERNRINYELLLDIMSYENFNDIYKNKMVDVYLIHPTDTLIDLDINYRNTSTVITSGFDYRLGENYNMECNCKIREDIYIIDFDNDINVNIDNIKQTPDYNTTFKAALMNLIQYSNDNQLDDSTLNLYYNLIIGSESFSNQIYNFDNRYFNHTIKVNQYEVEFEPGEIKELTVTYDVKPSYYLTRTDPYYTYVLFLNQNNWYKYNNIAVNINLNEKYKYLKRNSFEVVKNENNSYSAFFGNYPASSITFGVFTSEEEPVMSCSAMGGGIVLLIIICLVVVILFVLFLIAMLIIVFVLILKKRRNRLYR